MDFLFLDRLEEHIKTAKHLQRYLDVECLDTLMATYQISDGFPFLLLRHPIGSRRMHPTLTNPSFGGLCGTKRNTYRERLGISDACLTIGSLNLQ